jgi:hypothetical protein
VEYPINALVRIASALTTLFTRLARILIDFTYGSSAYGISREIMQQRAEREQLLLFLLMGDQLGLPVYPSYYSRHLLPYIYPRLARWKRTVIRPKGYGEL